MKTIRRIYVYVASFIGLQVVAWAAIYLLRNLLSPQMVRTDLAWQLAFLIIALPLYTGHWLWADRLARRDTAEQRSILRRFYLWAALAAFVGPLIYQTLNLVDTLLQMAAGVDLRYADQFFTPPSQQLVLLDRAMAMAVLTLLAAYHFWILRRERKIVPAEAGLAVTRRLYQWGFTTAGLLMTAFAFGELLLQLLTRLLNDGPTQEPGAYLPWIAQLAVGLIVWLFFWSWSQRLFKRDAAGERRSSLRKVYLYLVLGVSALTAVTNAAILLSLALQRLLGLRPAEQVSDILPPLITTAALWGYHQVILRQDAAIAPAVKEQITISQIYQYLIAGVGLLAFLIGLGGIISVLIRAAAGERFDREEVSWYIAAIAAGLPVWLWPWRQIQQRLAAERSVETASLHESGSLVRRTYLYIFILLATLTILASGVYLVYRLLTLVMGLTAESGATVEIAHAFAFALLALAIWLYHGRLIRRDGRALDARLAARLANLHVAVLDFGDGRLGAALGREIRQKLSQVNLHPLGLTSTAQAAMNGSGEEKGEKEREGEGEGEGEGEKNEAVPTLERTAAILAAADIIVAPWQLAAGGAGVNPAIAEILAASQARKVLIPTAEPGWTWSGVEELATEAAAREAAEVVEHLAIDQEMGGRRRWGAGAILGLIAGGILLFFFLTSVINLLVSLFS